MAPRWGLVEPVPPETEKSIAVLPLVTLGGDADDEYFSTGLTEDIVTQLSKIPDLEVASSRSSLRYRDTEKSHREIGQELGVATLLEATIRRQADRVRVNVELIDASTSRNLWADVFEGQMSDIFAMQTEIAEKLAARLKVELSAETERSLEQSATVHPEAYELVLRGRYFRSRESGENMNKTAEYFEKATERDPRYALAWALLSDAYFVRGYVYPVPESPELFAKAERAADRALELDDTLAEAYVTKGNLLAHQAPRDAAAGVRELRHAVELDPRLTNAHRELGLLLLRTMGRVQEALDEFRIADELYPFWHLTKGHLIEAYIQDGDPVNAMHTARALRELDEPYWGLAFTAWAVASLQDSGRAEPFLDEMIEANQVHSLGWAALFLALNGRTAEATTVAGRLLQVSPDGRAVNTVAGVVALFAGEYGAATQHLERARELSRDPVGWGTWMHSALYRDHATLLGYALLKTGDEDRALRLFEETERFYTDRIAGGDTTIRARVGIAAVHALRGDREAAYEWLQQAIDTGFFQYAELEQHPCFESLHGEERFQRMMAGVRTRVEEMRRRVDAMEKAGD